MGYKLISRANQAIYYIDRQGHGDWYLPFGSWKSGNEINVDFGRNADDKIGMNPLRTTGILHPHITRSRLSNCDIFDLFSRPSDLAYRFLQWHGMIKSETGNLRGNKNFENTERESNFKVEKVGCKNSVIWDHNDSNSIHGDTNHNNSIINWNHKDSELIHVDPNHTNSNQPIPANLTDIGSIHDSADICSIENILTSPVHYPVPTPPICFYGRARYPLSPLHDSSEDSVTPKVNPKPRGNPPNPVPKVLDDPDSNPSLSDSSFSESDDSSDDEYYKIIQSAKNDKKKLCSKTCSNEPIRKCANLTSKLLKSAYKSKVVKFKSDEYPLQPQVYFLSFMNSPENIITKCINMNVAYGLSINKTRIIAILC